MATVAPPARRRMALAEFLAWEPDDPTGARWQLRGGVPERIPPAPEAHGAILALLAAHLVEHARRTGGGGVRAAANVGLVPRLGTDREYRVADLALTRAPPSDGHALPDPVAAFEVLSPGDEARTRANLAAHATIPTVAEVVLVHSLRVAAEVLRRSPDGTWPERPEALGPDDALRVECVGFTVPLRDLYRTTRLGAGG